MTSNFNTYVISYDSLTTVYYSVDDNHSSIDDLQDIEDEAFFNAIFNKVKLFKMLEGDKTVVKIILGLN